MEEIKEKLGNKIIELENEKEENKIYNY